MRIIKLFVFIVFHSWLFAISATEILNKVDDNTVVASMRYKAVMEISIGGRIMTKEFKGYSVGKELAYIEFTAPARDRGVRFLKIDDEMWMYLPEIERATKIAGHMLRQSLMGSDFSYGDITENAKLIELYDVELLGEDTVSDNPCYLLELTAKNTEVNYAKRRIWVRIDIFVPVKSELYARSDKLLKEVFFSDFTRFGKYTYPRHIKMVNKLRKDTYTILNFSEIELDVKIADKIFTRAYLERR